MAMSNAEVLERIESCIRATKVVVRPTLNGDIVMIYAEDVHYEKPGKRYLFMMEFSIEAYRRFFEDEVPLMPPIRFSQDGTDATTTEE